MDLGILLITVLIGAAIAGLVWSLSRNNKKSYEEQQPSQPVTERQEKKQQDLKPKKKVPVHSGKDSKAQFTHSWLLTTLKGHTGPITDLDFSANGKHLATCSEDGSIMLWKLKLASLERKVTELNMKDVGTVRTVVQYDTPSLIRWSPDSKALLIVRSQGNNIEIYKVAKKPEGGDLPSVQVSHDLPKTRETDLMTLDVASTGRFILTCTPKNELDILDLKGNILSSIATNQMETYCAKISPDGRFVACSGFTPDVRVWEVLFTKSGDFDKVNKAFELTGHSSGIYSFDFSPDSGLMATVSKDGTWKVFNTNIDYKQGQLATVMVTGKWKNSSQAKVALSPDGRVIAIACESSIYFYSVLNGELYGQIDNAHSVPMKCIRFDASSRFLLTTGDKYVRVFHNVPGFKVAIADLELKLKKATSNAMRDRCQQQIKEYQSLIALIEK